jgi:hypothetical protein
MPTQPQPTLSAPPLRRRRRKRQEGATAKQPALPALSAQDYDQIRELAAQTAAEMELTSQEMELLLR